MLYSRRRASFALSVLFAINLMNFYDRQIIGAVMEPIRKKWDLSDTDIGILGTAFVLIYAAVGVPLGRLSDRFPRTRILAGITVWSVLTAASGAAWSYSSMFAARLGVGIGEASCHRPPIRSSGISSLPNQRGRALSIFMLGLPLGIFFSNWLSGSDRAPLRMAGRLLRRLRAGAPLRFAHAFHQRARCAARPTRRTWERRPYSRRNGRGLRISSSSARRPSFGSWLPAASQLQYVRTQRFCAGPVDALLRRGDQTAGLVAGVSLGAVGIVGLLVGGWVADRVQRVRPNGRLLVAALAMLLSVPCLYFGISQPPGQMAGFMAWVGAGVMLMYVYYAGVYAAIQDVVEPGLRGTAMALYFFVMYVLGGAFGTYVLGGLSDWFALRAMRMAGESLVKGRVPEQFRGIGLHQAMYVVPILCVGLAIVLFAASRTVGRDMRKLAEWYAESSGAAARRIRQTAGRCGRRTRRVKRPGARGPRGSTRRQAPSS